MFSICNPFTEDNSKKKSIDDWLDNIITAAIGLPIAVSLQAIADSGTITTLKISYMLFLITIFWALSVLLLYVLVRKPFPWAPYISIPGSILTVVFVVLLGAHYCENDNLHAASVYAVLILLCVVFLVGVPLWCLRKDEILRDVTYPTAMAVLFLAFAVFGSELF